MPAVARFCHRRRVAFAETDLAGIVHFSNFYRYMEDCEHAFYRSLGYSVHAMDDGEGGSVAWPRVHSECDFRLPLRFEDEFETELELTEIGTKTLRYRFTFWRLDAAGNRSEEVSLAEGKMVVVCVRMGPEGMKSVPVPASIRARIESSS